MDYWIVGELVKGPMDSSTTVDLPESVQFSTDDFIDFCRRNPNKHIEQNANGGVVVLALSGCECGRQNALVTGRLGEWSRSHGGIVLAHPGFRLPNGATRAPDSAWISQVKWDAVPEEEREKFPEMVPELVVEIVSPSDTLERQVAKMEEYATNGVLLGWLIIPKSREVRIYRAGAESAEVLSDPESVEADDDQG